VTEGVRVDVWLDVSCLFKTRSEAKRACEAGRVDVNGDHARPHRLLREGDRLTINRGAGRRQSLIVRVVTDAHVRKADARSYYEDLTPPPTPEEVEMRRQDRAYRAAALAAGTPDRRHRKQLRRLKGLD
jgi:ribosome-associated heat shock protein Hsp15